MLDIIELINDHDKQIKQTITDFVKENPDQIDELISEAAACMVMPPTSSDDEIVPVDALSAAAHLASVLNKLFEETGDETFKQKSEYLHGQFYGLMVEASQPPGNS
jgi:hypothetical protein